MPPTQWVRSAAASLALAVVGVLAPAAPSHATGSLFVEDGVLYDDCVDHPYTFSVLAPRGTDSWSMTVTAYGPDGLEEASDFVFDDISTGSGELLFCGTETPGDYELVAEVEYNDFDRSYGGTTYEELTAYFSMAAPATTTTLRASSTRPKVNSAITFTATARDERPYGFFPTRYATVRLQYLDGGRWRLARSGETYTDNQGRAQWKYRWGIKGAVRLRAYTPAEPPLAASVSPVITVRAR